MKTIQSSIIGVLKQVDDFDDWWESDPIDIPFFENKKIAITYMDFTPESDSTFIEEADLAIKTFLSKVTNDRLSISSLAYKNCMDFLKMVEYDEADQPLWDITDKNDIWKFIYPHDIYATRGHGNDEGIYINATCECEWEQEHGFQMVFKRGDQLVRLSAQDGYIGEEEESITNTQYTPTSSSYESIQEQQTISFWSKLKKLWS